MSVQPELPRPAANEFVVPDRQTFLWTLDLQKPALAGVRRALGAGDVAVMKIMKWRSTEGNKNVRSTF